MTHTEMFLPSKYIVNWVFVKQVTSGKSVFFGKVYTTVSDWITIDGYGNRQFARFESYTESEFLIEQLKNPCTLHPGIE